MPFADATPPDSRPATTTTTTYSTPSNADLAAVAATVGVVGVVMAILVAWLIFRLRNAHPEPDTIPVTTRRPASYVFRPSFAPSESSSKFSFARKPLRLSHRRQDGSWDFADPDPFHFEKECLPDPPSRPAPLTLAPAYSSRAHCASTHKDEGGLRTPTTPTTPTDAVDPPPPAYCRESMWSVYPSKRQSLS